MGLTNQQDIPNKAVAPEPWTRKLSLPFIGAITSLSKVFINPIDVLLGYLVFIFGITEILDRQVSIFFWILIILILAIVVFERNKDIFLNTKIKEK